MTTKTLASLNAESGTRGQDSGVRQVGFDAKLKHVTLPDLIQMECLAGSARSLRIVSGKNSGYLMFSGGQVVHAMTRALRGEAAALEILSWQYGSVEPCSLRLSDQRTIAKKWQELLMLAAQRSDEGASEGSNVTELDDAEFLSADEPEMLAVAERKRQKVIRATRLNARGEVVVARGEEDPEGFAEASAYAARMAHVIGDLLGMDGFRGLEWTLPDRAGILYLEENGGMAALEALPQADLTGLRRRVGL
ncbi:MAG: DUF4388 domain-containing protein [Polyangiaceae bacterium]|nr:DUF4388 domain-containing protein [Polyangiaceae bacterium]